MINLYRTIEEEVKKACITVEIDTGAKTAIVKER
jgi:hypothetical protein